MGKSEISILVVLILYMISMLALGAVFSRRKMSLNDYILGGRQLNPWVSAMSTQASDMSGWLLTGIPGLAYATAIGAKEAIWTALGLLIGTVINWLFIAKRLRVYSQIAGNSLTIPSYFENRFKDKKGILRLFSAIVILIFFTVYTASMFSAGAKLFTNIFPIGYKAALFIGAAVIIVYTFLGGFLAVSWTDLFQGLLMFFALIIIPIVMAVKMPDGGMIEVNDVWAGVVDFFSFEVNQNGEYMTFGALGIVSSLAWGLGYFGMPHILVRFMATKDKKTIKSATVIALIWVVISMGCALAIGIMAVGLDNVHIDDKEQVLIEVVRNNFPPVVAGLLLSAVLAAIMSTADSQLLVAASAFSNDIYKRHIRKNASDAEALWVSRISIIVVSIVALLIALNEKSSIFELVGYAWAGFGASFGPLMLFSLYSKRITLKGAVASIITGAVVTISFRYGFSRLGGVWEIYELLPGFICSAAVLWIVSLIDRKNIDPEIETDFANFKKILKSKEDDLTVYEKLESKEVALEVAGAKVAVAMDNANVVLATDDVVVDDNVASSVDEGDIDVSNASDSEVEAIADTEDKENN